VFGTKLILNVKMKTSWLFDKLFYFYIMVS
jgi:hypothetical protein